MEKSFDENPLPGFSSAIFSCDLSDEIIAREQANERIYLHISMNKSN
jgi:hypothetical protein